MYKTFDRNTTWTFLLQCILRPMVAEFQSWVKNTNSLFFISLFRQVVRDRLCNLCDLLQAPIQGSFYIVHLREWLQVFPREQIYIFRNEDYTKDIKGTISDICRYLNVCKYRIVCFYTSRLHSVTAAASSEMLLKTMWLMRYWLKRR